MTKTSSNTDFLVFPEWPTLQVTGPDAGSWLNAIVTGDVASVAPGKGNWSSLLSKQGKVQADLQIVGSQDDLSLGVAGGEADEVLSTLDGYLIMEDAEISKTDRQWVLAVGERGRAAAEASGLPFSELPWGGPERVLAASVPEAELASIRQQNEELIISGTDWDAWLIEQGVPRLGVEYTTRDNLHAASLERRTVDWSKGCYLGQEVVCMQDMRGKVRRRLVRLSSSHPIPNGAELTVEGGDLAVGSVVSSAGLAAIASVQAPHFEPKTEVVVGELTATVRALRD